MALLNGANAVFLGAVKASQVYLGNYLVWGSIGPVPPIESAMLLDYQDELVTGFVLLSGENGAILLSETND